MQKNTKVDYVYDFIISELLQKHYPQGERLVISRIAKDCQTSEIPVREALRRLESDGFIKIDANRGATVVGITRETIRDIAETKGVLEGYATRIAVDYLSPKDIRVLYDINEELHAAALNNDDELYSRKNKQFHHFIYEHIPNSEIQGLIDKLWVKWNFTAHVFTATPQRMITSFNEHLIILSLIESRQYEELEKFVRKHKVNALSLWSEEFSEKQ